MQCNTLACKTVASSPGPSEFVRNFKPDWWMNGEWWSMMNGHLAIDWTWQGWAEDGNIFLDMSSYPSWCGGRLILEAVASRCNSCCWAACTLASHSWHCWQTHRSSDLWREAQEVSCLLIIYLSNDTFRTSLACQPLTVLERLNKNG